MSISKLRAALIVFCVGFALGLSVFAASRMFVRSVLSADATNAAVELAGRLAGGAVEASGALSNITRYTRFDADGAVVETGSFAPAEGGVAASSAQMQELASRAAQGRTVVAHAPLLPSLLGLSETFVRGVAVPIVSEGRPGGSLYVEVDQATAIDSLARVFSVVAMVKVGLAVLALVATLLAVTGGRGVPGERRSFDHSSLPHDPLTGLLTRHGFSEALADAVRRAAEADHQVGLMIVSLNDFRRVNDIWGHAAGDAALAASADRLHGFVADPALLARISGTRFAVIVERDATSHALRRLAEKMQAALRTPIEVAGSSITLGASIGAALFPVNADNPQMLFRAADAALSKAKSQGHDALAFFDTEMMRRVQRRAERERDLRQALQREQFVVFYQPQMELASGRLRGYEALLRWERPGEGILAPSEFLAIAEQNGLIGPLGDWVLRKACSDAASWPDAGIVAVNFCAEQFRACKLDESVAAALAESGLDPGRLELEIPESLILGGAPEVIDTLTRVKALGVRIAIDDFGAGYSGLRALAQFPFDKVKIDKSFVGQLAEDPDVAAIVASLVGLGRALAVDIAAEGVETRDQVTLLKAAGCSIVQGFLFGVPRRPEARDEADASAAGAASSAIGGG